MRILTGTRLRSFAAVANWTP